MRIVATGEVTVNGRISADSVAANGTDGSRYGGSGGSVWITAKTVGGSGEIRANGGTGSSTTANNGYTGGGGRVAVEYDAAAMDAVAEKPTISFSADSPTLTGPWEASSVSGGDIGTLYFTDARFVGTNFTTTCAGVRCGEIHAGSWAGWSPASLAVNNVRVRFVEETPLGVSIPGEVYVTGENARLYFGGDRDYAWSAVGGVVKYSSYAPRVTFGSLKLGPGGDFYICPAATNGNALTDRQAQLTVVGKLSLNGNTPWGNGDTLLVCDCHPTNGASVRIVCDSCEINEKDDEIRSKGYGVDGSCGTLSRGLGPGASAIGGAGYGGVGSAATPGAGGAAYGDAVWPLLPGSTADGSGPAGGVIWMEVAHGLKLTGKISASGISAGNDTRCASGGSVCITCETLSGNGTISATGVSPSLSGSSDMALAGGGGRIAIHYDETAQAALESPSSVKIVANGGFGWNWRDNPKFENADMGTVWLPDGTLLGDTLSTAKGVQSGAIHLGDWASWQPSPLTVDGVRVRLSPGATPLSLPGDVVLANVARLGFGGGFPAELRARLLGAECCCWTEGTRNADSLRRKTWPRAAVFAASAFER